RGSTREATLARSGSPQRATSWLSVPPARSFPTGAAFHGRHQSREHAGQCPGCQCARRRHPRDPDVLPGAHTVRSPGSILGDAHVPVLAGSSACPIGWTVGSNFLAVNDDRTVVRRARAADAVTFPICLL